MGNGNAVSHPRRHFYFNHAKRVYMWDLDSRRRPPGAGRGIDVAQQNKYNASYGAMEQSLRLSCSVGCAMMSDGSCKKTKKNMYKTYPIFNHALRSSPAAIICAVT